MLRLRLSRGLRRGCGLGLGLGLVGLGLGFLGPVLGLLVPGGVDNRQDEQEGEEARHVTWGVELTRRMDRGVRQPKVLGK